MVRVVVVVLHGVKAVLAVAPLALLVTELMAVYMAAAALVLYITLVITMVVLVGEALYALSGPARLAHTHQLAQAHHESLY